MSSLFLVAMKTVRTSENVNVKDLLEVVVGELERRLHDGDSGVLRESSAISSCPAQRLPFSPTHSAPYPTPTEKGLTAIKPVISPSSASIFLNVALVNSPSPTSHWYALILTPYWLAISAATSGALLLEW